jgi:hypothetical protein
MLKSDRIGKCGEDKTWSNKCESVIIAQKGLGERIFS